MLMNDFADNFNKSSKIILNNYFSIFTRVNYKSHPAISHFFFLSILQTTKKIKILQWKIIIFINYFEYL